MASTNKGGPLPKFGEWDVNDPASAEGYSMIFNKARDEKKSGGTPEIYTSQQKYDKYDRKHKYKDPTKRKWLCCF